MTRIQIVKLIKHNQKNPKQSNTKPCTYSIQYTALLIFVPTPQFSQFQNYIWHDAIMLQVSGYGSECISVNKIAVAKSHVSLLTIPALVEWNWFIPLITFSFDVHIKSLFRFSIMALCAQMIKPSPLRAAELFKQERKGMWNCSMIRIYEKYCVIYRYRKCCCCTYDLSSITDIKTTHITRLQNEV